MLAAGRYALHRRIASGGMASVYFGRSFGAEGFSRVVAIKRLHPELATDSAFVAALLDEARLTSRIRHPNVVPVLDVVSSGDELWVVMEYVHGEKLSTLIKRAAERGGRLPVPVAVAIAADALRGLHAAHEARAPSGESLSIVHRDVSPQNILVSAEGVALMADFGIAKAAGRSQTTREGQIKGKLAYMAYEQLSGAPVTRRTDIWAASTVLWEMLAGERLFSGDSDGHVYSQIVQHAVVRPRDRVPEISPELDALVMRGLARDPEQRPATALELALALEAAVRPATRGEVAAFVTAVAGDVLDARARAVAEVERGDAAQVSVESAGEEPPRAESTQVSTGVARPAPAKRSRRWPIFGASAVLVVLAALAAASWPRALSDPPAPEQATTPASETAVAPLAASQPAPATQPAAAPDASAPAAKRAPVPARRALPRAPKPAPAPAPKREACRVLGSDGIWRIKPGCL